MAARAKKIDEFWEKVFNDFDVENKIENHGFFEITAKEIKSYKEEARLMTKFDNKSALPNCFFYDKDREKRVKKAGKHLSILPTTRGTYLVGAFDAYHKIDKNPKHVHRVRYPSEYETLSIERITSEAMALNLAYASGILTDFTDDDNLMPTVNGRMGSGIFDFNVSLDKKKVLGPKSLLKINIQNSQIEIDGGFEGDNSLSLIEAKNVISDDFLVRQVYYPYRTWSGRVDKKINNIFMTYSNETYNLYQYDFEDINCPESINLVKSASYTFTPPIDLNTIVELMKTVKYVQEPQVPFPQADDFRKIVSLCESLNKTEQDEEYEPLTKIGVAIKFGFHLRQSDYYINAARYLGLVELTNINTVILTSLGKRIFSMPPDNRNKALISAILSHKVFNESLKLYFKSGGKIRKTDIVQIMRQCSLYNIDSEDTYFRRASSIIGWIKWIILLTDESI